MAETADVIVIGAGVAGASAAFRLAPKARVVLLEAESQPGYHTSGRSAALYSKRYKNPLIRGLAAASGGFLENPPDGFAAAPLLAPRGLLIIGDAGQADAVKDQFTPEQIADGVAQSTTVEDAVRLVPCLDPDYVAHAMLVPKASDIDVHALHRGYLAGARQAGAKLVCDAPATKIARADGAWRVETPAGAFEAPIVVNAAGAWADKVAELAGLSPLNVRPLRRTCVTFDPPSGLNPGRWPMAMDADEAFYFKPEAGRILASPCDETESAPVDAQPEEIDVAHAVDRVERATTLSVGRITHRWAGLRVFMPDRLPAIGQDPRADGFVWIAGLGGFGMMTSEAAGRAAAAAALGDDLPADLTAAGVDPAAMSPARFL